MINLRMLTKDTESVSRFAQTMKNVKGIQAVNRVTTPQRVNVNDTSMYLTTFYLTFDRELRTLSELQTYFHHISDRWDWSFCSVVCSPFIYKGWDICFADWFPGEDGHELFVQFFVMGETLEETIHCLKDLDHPALWRFEYMGAEPYYKIDNCFIVTAKVIIQQGFGCSTVEELVNHYTRNYEWIGLTAQSTGSFFNEGIVEITASCKLKSRFSI